MKVRLLVAARRELEEAIRFYRRQSEIVAKGFHGDVYEAIKRIEKFPMAWQSISTRFRRCQLTKFPYGLIYQCVREEAIVVAVAHLHRQPHYWECEDS